MFTLPLEDFIKQLECADLFNDIQPPKTLALRNHIIRDQNHLQFSLSVGDILDEPGQPSLVFAIHECTGQSVCCWLRVEAVRSVGDVTITNLKLAESSEVLLLDVADEEVTSDRFAAVNTFCDEIYSAIGSGFHGEWDLRGWAIRAMTAKGREALAEMVALPASAVVTAELV